MAVWLALRQSSQRGLMGTTPICFYENGQIWTGDPSTPWANALVVANERLFAVGERRELGWLRARADKIVDLENHLVLPGFNDAHLHAFEGGKSLLEIDLRTVKSIPDLKEHVRDYAARLADGDWITGGNWDHQNWGGHPFPDRRMLDEAAGSRPALLFRVDWHVAVANSAALRAAGIDRNTPDPPGGEIERDSHGEPTGVLKDAAAELVLSVVPEPTDERLKEILRAALSEAARYGVTSYQDNVTVRQFRVYQELARAQELKVRVNCWFPLSELEQLTELNLERNFGNPWLQIGTVKLFADGSLGAGTAYFFDAYADRPGYRGLLTMSETDLEKAIGTVHKAGLQAAVHAIGDAANALVLDIFERLGTTPTRRHRIEHAQTIRDSDLPRFARLGVVASVQPVHAVDDLRWAHRKIGERIRQSYRIASFLRNGVQVAFGTDWPVASLNPMLGLEAATSRQMLNLEGTSAVNGSGGHETISVEQAVRLYTEGSAFAQGREHEKGTLAPGKLADFVVLDRNVFNCEPGELRSAQVLMTVVGGEIVHES